MQVRPGFAGMLISHRHLVSRTQWQPFVGHSSCQQAVRFPLPNSVHRSPGTPVCPECDLSPTIGNDRGLASRRFDERKNQGKNFGCPESSRRGRHLDDGSFRYACSLLYRSDDERQFDAEADTARYLLNGRVRIEDEPRLRFEIQPGRFDCS